MSRETPHKRNTRNGAVPVSWPHATAIVLAGGKSRRMRTDKALLPVNGVPLIQRICRQLHDRFGEILISAASGAQYSSFGFRVVEDESPGSGPMTGVISSLSASRHGLNLVVPCDMPDVDFDVVERLFRAVQGHQAAVPETAKGFPEPVFALYDQTVLSSLRAQFQAGERSLSRALRHCRVARAKLPPGYRLPNLNVLTDYHTYLRGR